MKFLLEIVPCFGYHQQLERSAAGEEMRTDDDVWSLMKQPPTPQKQRKKRGRVASTAAAAEWKPSLSSISEDRPAVTVRVVKSGNESPANDADKRQVRRKSGGSGSVYVRSRGDDFGRNAFETMVPAAFTPTPFMF